MYADKMTDSMTRAIEETNRRREKQVAFNKEKGIDPQPLRKKISDITDSILSLEKETAEMIEQGKKRPRDGKAVMPLRKRPDKNASYNELIDLVVELEDQMKSAAAELNFELAARLRDEISELKYTIRHVVS